MDYSMILILVVMVAVFYFMIIRPEKKKKKKPHRDLSGYAGGSLVCWHISGSWLFTACKLSETCDRAAELKR